MLTWTGLPDSFSMFVSKVVMNCNTPTYHAGPACSCTDIHMHDKTKHPSIPRARLSARISNTEFESYSSTHLGAPGMTYRRMGYLLLHIFGEAVNSVCAECLAS